MKPEIYDLVIAKLKDSLSLAGATISLLTFEWYERSWWYLLGTERAIMITYAGQIMKCDWNLVTNHPNGITTATANILEAFFPNLSKRMIHGK